MAESQSVSRLPAVGCGLLYVLSFMALAGVLRSHFGFPLDDSWIHQVIARNLVVNHVLGFVWRTPSSGSTSLLWTLLLAAGRMALPGLSQVWFCAVLNGLFLFGIGYWLKRITEEDGLDLESGWVVALAPALSGNFLWFGLTGMEHLLFLFLTVMLVDRWFARDGKRLSWWIYVAAGLLVLTRPEGLVLAGLLALAARKARRSVREVVGICCGAGAAVLISAVVNWKISGRVVPQTMQGRQLLAGYSMGFKGRMIFLGQIYARLLKTWSIVGSNELMHGRGAVLGVGVGLILLGLVLLGLMFLWAMKAERLLLLAVWAVAVPAMYFVALPNTGHGGRYIAISVMMFLALLFLGVYKAVDLMAPERVGIGIAALVAVITLSVSLAQWRRAAADGIDQINTEHAVMGEWLAKNLPQGSFDPPRVAAFDIGGIGYEVNGRLVDVGGLVDPKFVPYVLKAKTAEYLAQHGVRWVVLPTEQDAGDAYYRRELKLEPKQGADLSPVYTVCADPEKAKVAMAATAAAFACQTLYAVGQ